MLKETETEIRIDFIVIILIIGGISIIEEELGPHAHPWRTLMKYALHFLALTWK